MIDIKDPAEPFSVGEFCQLAKGHIKQTLSSDRIPFLVGGTMLYFDSLLHGRASLPPASDQVRQQIEAEATEHGWAYLHASLKRIDEAAFFRIHPNDKQRIQRAIEVFRLTGKPISSLQNKPHSPLPAKVIKIIIEPRDRTVLHQRIEQRLQQMFAAGFVDEVKVLFERGDLNEALPSIRSVGYRQVWSFLSGEITEDELFNRALYATRQLAKRQLTWLRRCSDGYRFYVEDKNLCERVLSFIKEQMVGR